jgi:8-oxo-dGTP pyrophosphatase MutT (NUDIX family)
MLHLIPAPLHRALYRVADRLRRRWWRLRKPQHRSVIVLATDDSGRVLLVRHSYGQPVWTLPGGGIDRNEDPLAAAIREFREELRCELAELRPLVSSVEDVSGSRDMQNVFLARLAGTPRPDMREVVEARLFDPAALPANLSRIAVRRIAAWQSDGA